MNRTYKLVWNAMQQAWVVASELGKSHKKSKAARLVLAVAALSVGQLAMAVPATRAIPVLDNIASGAATVTAGTASDGRTLLTVDQTSDKLVANWTSFEVGQFSRVLFNQPTASSMALNRIAATAPSQIFGQVQANGQIILVNPAGIVFGSSGRVNAGSVIASTLDITDANFNAGVLQFDRGTSTGAIDNQGIIIAENGNTFVFAPTVTNSGTLRAQAGNVTIANGNRLTVDATAGTATLNQVSGIAGLIQSTGVIRGDRLSTTDKGKVFIVGDRVRTGSVVKLAGEINSTGSDIKAKTLNITGDLSVNSNTTINAINSINVNGAVNVVGNNRLISIDYDNDAAGDDYLYFGENGKISMPGNTITYREQGVTYNIIRTLDELKAIGTNSTTLADKYVLGMDIDASSTATTAFTPIGSTSDTPFTGFISGLGNTVSNLTINLPSTTGVGLFGYAQNSTIKSLKLSNVNITGDMNVGGLIGQSGTYTSNIPGNGTYIFNNSVSGTVNGVGNVGGLIGVNYSTPINYSNASATVTSSSGNVGGLVGSNVSSNITNSFATGTVGSSISSGGLIGNNKNSLVDNSYATGSVSGIENVGGLIGNNENSAISRSYATGTVNASSNEAGGLVGENKNSDIADSHATGNVQGISKTGGLIGSSADSSITRTYATGNVITGAYGGGLIGSVSASKNIVLDENYATGNVTVNGPELGGLIGRITINSPNVVNISNSFSTGNVEGGGQKGGLIGYVINHGEFNLSNTYNSGMIISTYINNSTGTVIGEVDNGAGAAAYYSGNYWNSDLNPGILKDIGYKSSSNHNFGTPSQGLTTTQSTQLSSYSGWDISNQLTGSNSIWYINEGVSTPVLRALMTP
jgi:filamentous hemagglutinin family protein